MRLLRLLEPPGARRGSFYAAVLSVLSIELFLAAASTVAVSLVGWRPTPWQQAGRALFWWPTSVLPTGLAVVVSVVWWLVVAWAIAYALFRVGGLVRSSRRSTSERR